MRGDAVVVLLFLENRCDQNDEDECVTADYIVISIEAESDFLILHPILNAKTQTQVYMKK